ncbi:MAG: RDD family protein [Pseudomonadota bacterium]
MPELAPPPAAAPALDTLYRVETPEGVALALRPAGLAARSTAFTIDLVIRVTLAGVTAGVLEPFAGIGAAFWLLFVFLMEWFYPVAFELSPAAATPGKMAVGLQVVMDNGLPITVGASLLRNLLRAVDFLPLAYGIGLACLLLRRDFKRLGDVAASTLVVYRAERSAPAAWPDAAVDKPGIPLSFAQQRALLHLAGRARRITPQRVDELAALIAPVVWPHRAAGPEAADRLIGVARWLRGDR